MNDFLAELSGYEKFIISNLFTCSYTQSKISLWFLYLAENDSKKLLYTNPLTLSCYFIFNFARQHFHFVNGKFITDKLTEIIRKLKNTELNVTICEREQFSYCFYVDCIQYMSSSEWYRYIVAVLWLLDLILRRKSITLCIRNEGKCTPSSLTIHHRSYSSTVIVLYTVVYLKAPQKPPN